MQRIALFKKISTTPTIKRFDHVPRRFMASVQEVFPHKTDFPSRHIGPRKTEVVAMLDYIGFKVSALFFLGKINFFDSKFQFHFRRDNLTKFNFHIPTVAG